MRFVSRTLLVLILAGLAIFSLGANVLSGWNDRQTSGSIALPILDAPVRVLRDDLGTPYIYADSLDDAIRAQGFVAGQDRLFQLEAAKRAATGRLAEVFGAGEGDVILNLDRQSRLVGFHRLAEQQEAVLSEDALRTLEAYRDGLNAYIETRAHTHHKEFGLAGFSPEPWEVQDLLALTFYLGWASSANYEAELIAHEVIGSIGAEAFQEIAPLTVNPDDGQAPGPQGVLSAPQRYAGLTAPAAPWMLSGWQQQGHGGSNNWAISGAKANAPAAIVTNDPHLDARTLPGPWHPVGIITPELRIVGVSTGLPGVVVGRNEHIAFGVTNAYADAVDVYVETLDPQRADHYLEGTETHPLDVLTETIRVKDDDVPGGMRDVPLVIRSTSRGPIITDHGEGGADGAVLSLRWAAAEFMGPELGLDQLMRSQNVDEALAAITEARIVSLNFVVGDVTGRVGRRASGAAPIRLRGDGMAPFPVTDGIDNWGGRIPGNQMPGEIDPAHGWTGTANHMTAPSDYPYVYTTYASPAFRYRRIQEIMQQPTLNAEEVWAAQYDAVNLFARGLAPIFAAALAEADDPALQDLGRTLAAWGHEDRADLIEPTLFHETVRQLAQATYEDELGEELTARYLSNWYVWQQRFDALVQEDTSPWFDDTRTGEVEDRDALIRRAGRAALDRLTEDYGPDRANWRWGKLHQIQFTGPLRLEGIAGGLAGGRSVQMSGSGETLLRALYPFDAAYDTRWFASLRMTADLNDPDKVRAVLPGGTVGRTFHPNLNDQVSEWMDPNTQTYWWFSDAMIEQNAKSVLTLTTAP